MKIFWILILSSFLIFASCGDKTTVENDVDSETADSDTAENDSEENDSDIWDIFEAPIVNPSGNIPLSASVNIWLIDCPASVSVTVKGIEEGGSDLEVTYDTSDHYGWAAIPILGLFPDYENTVVLKALDSDGGVIQEKEFKIQTGTLPKNFPTVELEGTIDSGWTMVNWLFTPRERPEMAMIAVDELGRIRWYTDFAFPAAFPIKIHNGYIYTSEGGDILYKFDLMGFEIEKWDVSEHGFTEIHHEIVIKDDGNIILAVSKIDDPMIEDRIIEINPETNQLRGTWDLKKTFPDLCDLFNDVPLTEGNDPNGLTNEPVHNNAFWYNEEDDSLIVSSQRSGVAKLTHSGYLKWFFAPHIIGLIDDEDADGMSDSLMDGYDADDMTTHVGDFKGESYIHDRMPIAGKPHEVYSSFDFRYQEFLLDPIDKDGKEITDSDVLNGFTDHDDFAYPFRQHTPVILKNGNLMVFDNGLARNFSYPPIFNDHFSRAVEYEIVSDSEDGYGGTVKQVWEYVLENDPMWYSLSIVVSGANELENGNRLITSGSIGSSFFPDQLKMLYGDGPIGAMIVEVDPTDNTQMNKLFFSRYIDDEYPNAQFSAYRAYRFDLKGQIMEMR